jgi:uncharacterized protein YbjQ (UPF0145 family)
MPFDKEAQKRAKADEESIDNFHSTDVASINLEREKAKYKSLSDFSLTLTTTEFVPGKKIVDFKGIVFSSSSEMSNLGTGSQDERLLQSTYLALKSLERQAHFRGANAIIGIKISSSNSTFTNGFTVGMSDAVTATGTAVVIA